MSGWCSLSSTGTVIYHTGTPVVKPSRQALDRLLAAILKNSPRVPTVTAATVPVTRRSPMLSPDQEQLVRLLSMLTSMLTFLKIIEERWVNDPVGLRQIRCARAQIQQHLDRHHTRLPQETPHVDEDG